MAGLAVQQGLGPAVGLNQRAQVAQGGLGDVDGLPGRAGVGCLLNQRAHLGGGGGHRDDLGLGPVAGALGHGQHVDGRAVHRKIHRVLELPAHGGGPIRARHIGRRVHRHTLVLAALQQRHPAVPVQRPAAPQLLQNAGRLGPGRVRRPADGRSGASTPLHQRHGDLVAVGRDANPAWQQ